MMLGRVIGEVWATKKHERLGGRKLLLVAQLGGEAGIGSGIGSGNVHGEGELRCDGGEGDGLATTGKVIVALDTIGAQTGHVVTVSWGSGARAVIKAPDNRWVLADAAVSRIVDAVGFGGG